MSYRDQVSDIIAGHDRSSSYRPEEPVELFVANRKPVMSVDGLGEAELRQIVPMFRGAEFPAVLTEGWEGDGPINLEVATVVDGHGAVRYRLWGMDFGGIYLMEPDTLEVIAMATQHHMEHWHADQRPIFWAMDRGLARGGHGFQQPADFCWWNEDCWTRIAGKPRGTVGSEAYVREMFKGEN